MDILHLLWEILAFVLGLAWQLAWFVLRDLVSTALWGLIVAWLILSVRYRSFSLGALALLRYGTYGLKLFWRWLRGAPGAMPPPPREKQLQAAAVRRRKPFGTVSISEELNMLLVAAIFLLFLA
ncbi:MAG: hypothetical protein WCD20_08560 [Rhodomicrobium sp.]